MDFLNRELNVELIIGSLYTLPLRTVVSLVEKYTALLKLGGGGQSTKDSQFATAQIACSSPGSSPPPPSNVLLLGSNSSCKSWEGGGGGTSLQTWE